MTRALNLKPAYAIALIIGVSFVLLVTLPWVTAHAVAMGHDRGLVELSAGFRLLIQISNFLTTKWHLLALAITPLLTSLYLSAVKQERKKRHSRWTRVLAALALTLTGGTILITVGTVALIIAVMA